jgi:hypothetical protein
LVTIPLAVDNSSTQRLQEATSRKGKEESKGQEGNQEITVQRKETGIHSGKGSI